MAHECPDCGSVCYCGGDIDDCVWNMRQDVNSCMHCVCRDCGCLPEGCMCFVCEFCGANYDCDCDCER
jgi:hypothetical protein